MCGMHLTCSKNALANLSYIFTVSVWPSMSFVDEPVVGRAKQKLKFLGQVFIEFLCIVGLTAVFTSFDGQSCCLLHICQINGFRSGEFNHVVYLIIFYSTEWF